MSAPTWATLRDTVRRWSQDADTVNPLFTDAELLAEFNAQYIAWKGAAEDRVAYIQHNSLIHAANPIAASTVISLTLAANIRRIFRLYRTTGLATTDRLAELEIAEPFEVQALQIEKPTTGTPRMASFWRQQTATAAQVGKFQIVLWPIPSGDTYLLAEAIVEPSAIVNPADIPDVSDVEAYGLAWSAAAVCAFQNGRPPEWVAELKAHVPDHMQAALATMQKARVPRPRPSEDPA